MSISEEAAPSNNNLPPAIVSWSSGKDAMLAAIRAHNQFELVGLLTTYRESDNTIAMHEVPLSLVERQAHAMGLPLLTVPLPPQAPNDIYETRMRDKLREVSERLEVTDIICGDIALEDVRKYREEKLEAAGFSAHFPLWEAPSRKLAYELLDCGVRATIIAVEHQYDSQIRCGTEYSREFLKCLPDGVDPCGEYGEFHTFAHESPLFSSSIPLEIVGTRDAQWCRHAVFNL